MKTMYVYILQCSDSTLYTGVTNNLEERLEQHLQGINRNCYTFSRRPLRLVYYEIFNEPLSAISFEKKLKGWSKAKKIALIDSNWDRIKELSTCKNETNSDNFSPPRTLFDSAQSDNPQIT